MKNKKGLIVIILSIMLLVGLYTFINNSDDNTIINYLFFALIIVIGLYTITLIINRNKNIKSRSKDKLFNSLVKSSDTIYIMMDSNKKITYLSDNVEEILGIRKENRSDEQIVFEVLNIPIIKSELKNNYIEEKIIIREYLKPKSGLNLSEFFNHCENGKII